MSQSNTSVSSPLCGSSPQKSVRRRKIDPTTCERDYSAEEREFMMAYEAYKRSSGRNFPTCSEILEVIRDLGYRKLPV
ncbi:MAG: hypothetical protein VX738_00810 [Planctomycetota bacterium]|nr:hypothetical protein [Planctomycetota bacterium]